MSTVSIFDRRAHSLAELPVKFRNTLRTSPDPYHWVSRIRRNIHPDQFEALIGWMATFGLRSVRFQESRKPRSYYALRAETRVLQALPFVGELKWAILNFKRYSTVLQGFIDARLRISRLIVSSSYDHILTALDEIESAHGFSLWSIEIRIAVLQLSGGIEAQKAFLAKVRKETRSQTVEYLAYFLSERNEETTNPDSFRNTVIASLPQTTASPEFATYALFKLADHWPSSPAALGSILRWEYLSSLADYYETFIRLATRDICEHPGEESHFSHAVAEVSQFVDDERLKKLRFLATADTKSLASVPSAPAETTDAFLRGEYAVAIATALNSIPLHFVDPLITSVTAAADSGMANVTPSKSPFWDRVAELLLRVSAKKGNYKESFIELLRLATNLQNCHFGAAVAYTAITLTSSDVNPNRSLALRALVNDDGITTFVFPLLPVDHRHNLRDFFLSRGDQSLSLEAALFRANCPLTDQLSTIYSEISRIEILLDAAWFRSDFDEVIQVGDSDNDDSSPRHKRYIWRLVSNAMIRRGEVVAAAEYIVKWCLFDPDCASQMPIKACVESLNEESLRSIAGKISTPILLELYSRHVEDKPTELRYAHEDFLGAIHFAKPSDIDLNFWSRFELSQVVYYLRHVCVPRVMQLSPTYENSRAVQSERVAVCNLLKELDPIREPVYDGEIREITSRLMISTGLRQVEQSRVWIDQEPIKRWAEENLRESFVRYQSLRAAGLGISVKNVPESLKPISDQEPSKHFEIPEIPNDAPHELLTKMVSQFVMQCFLNRQHGLNSYLSLRIRHGALSGQLRAPIEAEKIITLQREAGSGEYAPNDYWIERLSPLNPEMALAVDLRLRLFSKSFDEIVTLFTKEHVQIAGDEHEKGLFIAGFVPLKVALMAYDIHADTTFDGFIDLCLAVFWDSVDRSLTTIREHISSKLLPEVNGLLISLLQDIEGITSSYETHELDNAIRNAQTHVRHALEQVKEWFRQPTANPPTWLEFKSIVEIGLVAVKNMYRDFDPVVTYEIGDLPLFSQLQKFTDIFIIIFSNISKHCGLITDPQVNIKAFNQDEFLHIEVRNDIAEGVRNSMTETRIEGIRQKIVGGMYHPAISSEGGTGLMKLRNIVSADRDTLSKFEFGFDGYGSFSVRLQLHSTVLDVDSPETQQ